MAKTHSKRESGDPAPPTVCDPLTHPMRTRILDVLNEEPMSPVRFLDDGFSPMTFNKRQTGLSYVSYHFRALEKAGCIEIMETKQRRGATEHIYRGCSRVFFSDAEFEALPFEKRQRLSQSSFQGLVARTDGAIRSGTFDQRPDRHMTWRGGDVDQGGWQEILDIYGEAYIKAEEARERAALRLAEEGGEAIPITTAMLVFESPPRKTRF
jgi:hypothetical protein